MGNTQHQRPDGLRRWAVLAVCTTGCRQILATTHVHAHDEEHAVDLGRDALRDRANLRSNRFWTVVAREANPAELGMVRIGETG